MAKNMNDFNHDLLKRYLAGQTTESENNQVEQWLLENGLGREDVRFALDNPDRIWVFDKTNQEKHWAIVEGKIKPAKKASKISFIWRAAAAVVLILLSIAGAGWWYNSYQHQIQIVSNATNRVMEYVLPDSTVVSLCSNSRLTFANNFKKNRSLTFEGLGFFKVKRDESHPFVIKTSLSEVKVLGTSFTVSTSENNTEVVVLTGKVAFFAPNMSADTVYLEKGEKGVFNSNSGSINKQENDNGNFLAWKSQKLIFENTPMEQVLRDLENYYQVKIMVESPNIYKLNYTSVFVDAALTEVLKEVEDVLNIQARTEGKTITLTLK